jgi:putative heme-binding domain-containing protein
LDYTLEHTIGALEPAWSEAYNSGALAKSNSDGYEFIASYVARRRPGLAAQRHLDVVRNPESNNEAREDGYASLEKLDGDRRNGGRVFQRVCAACHKVDNHGYDFGPDLSDVGKRLTRRELIESIIDPSKKVDAKYVTSTVITVDGKALVGFVKDKTEESFTLLMQEGKQQKLSMDDIEEIVETKQSSMPENLASTLAPAEFLDVIEFMSELQ